MPISTSKSIYLLIACGFLMLFINTGTSYADGNPVGSYTRTCKNINLNGENLTADCKTKEGAYKKTTLEFATSCVGIISNVDGNLACTGPVGSFARTCKDTKVEGETVYSTCERVDKTWNKTMSSFSGYQHPLTNCNGNLVDAPTCN